jgi:hypothetical protein
LRRTKKHEEEAPSEQSREEARERTRLEAKLPPEERQALQRSALDSLRTVAWFRALCETVGVHGYRASDLEKHWFRFGSKTDQLDHIDWRPYARGSQHPSEKTLHSVETYYPGLRQIYEKGELNLWLILGGDIQACTQAVNEQIAQHTKDEDLFNFGMSFTTKLEHFKDMLISPQARHFYDPVGHLILGRGGSHPVMASYFWACSDDPEAAAAGKMISPGLAVATIALSQLAYAYRDSFWIADYLMLGLIPDVLKDQFPAIAEPLAEFVEGLLRWRDTAALQFPQPKNADQT